jgi:hypothetical protein
MPIVGYLVEPEPEVTKVRDGERARLHAPNITRTWMITIRCCGRTAGYRTSNSFCLYWCPFVVHHFLRLVR